MAQLIQAAKKSKLNFAEELEKGNILFFDQSPFPFPQEDLDFLLQQKQTGAKNRKNIAYKPGKEKITNAVGNEERLLSIMRNYSTQVTSFLKTILPTYAACWKLDYASFRPFQEKGRELRLRARNDLLHTDAFPTRPMHGSRILRFFTNINPHESRKWMTSMPFEKLVENYGGEKGVPFPKSPNEHWTGKLQRIVKKAAKRAGFPIVLRSPYDEFMMNFHNYLKENEEFQKNCPKDHWDFPPGSCWIVFTDQVSHAALAGQYALEQTLIIPKSGLVHPELAPISVLERLSRERMIDPIFSNH